MYIIVNHIIVLLDFHFTENMHVNFPTVVPYYKICDLFCKATVHDAELGLFNIHANTFQGTQSDFFQ
jgi:hypothetical protein